MEILALSKATHFHNTIKKRLEVKKQQLCTALSTRYKNEYLQRWIHSTSYEEFHLSFHNKLVCFIHKPRFPLISNWERNYIALLKKKKEKWIRVPCCVHCISLYITRFRELFLQTYKISSFVLFSLFSTLANLELCRHTAHQHLHLLCPNLQRKYTL